MTNAAPTGSPVLDYPLGELVARDTPWRPDKCVLALGKQTAIVLFEDLAVHGIAHLVGPFPGRKSYLEVDDLDAQRQAARRLESAWRAPEEVTDARTGAFVDVMRNASDSFNRRRTDEDVIVWEWYPVELRPTIEGILMGEKLATSTE